jgi:hypothetical protein
MILSYFLLREISRIETDKFLTVLVIGGPVNLRRNPLAFPRTSRNTRNPRRRLQRYLALYTLRVIDDYYRMLYIHFLVPVHVYWYT